MLSRIWSGLIVLSAVISIAIAASSVWDEAVALWDVDTSAKIAAMKDGTHNPYREFNEFLNKVFYGSLNLPFAPSYFYSLVGNEAGFYLSCYFRDLALGTLVYWITAGLWHLTIYTIRGQEIFANNGRPFPKFETIADQMMLAQSAILIYAALPLVSEYLIQNKLTLAYYYIDQIGWGMYAVYFIIYIALVEIGIYWMHRTLHTNKFLYKYIHSLHHKYNKPTTLTPWASIAFNPIDGILQASPYVMCLFLVPMHYFTHVFLIFWSGVWATNIHDATWTDSEPIMGAKYHTVHHTHYHYNFGQFFTFCDAFWGTLRVPEAKHGKLEKDD